jgi:DNA-binding response OmpR family regulator
MKILVVDDEQALLEAVATRLSRDGHVVLSAPTAEDAWKRFREQRPDLIVLDVMLPGRSGFELSRIIRQESKVPILFLSARTQDADRLKGFEVGGDDYLTKPFNLAELSARVRAILRRSAEPQKANIVVSGDLKIDAERHEAWLGTRQLELAPKEFALLHFLAAHPGKVFSREVLLDRVWGPDAYVNPRTVDVHVRWLRKHIEVDDTKPERLQTVRGIGYRFA